jgi:hypothetical protein
MPVNQGPDFSLAAKGYMLVRGQFKGRAWSRTGRSDSTAVRSSEDARLSGLEDTIDHAEVWNDLSGGYGEPYRAPGSNRFDWAENMDTRFGGFWVHAQAFQPLQMTNTINVDGARIDTIPICTTSAYHSPIARNQILIQNRNGWDYLMPRTGSGNQAFWENGGGVMGANMNTGVPVARAAVFGSFLYLPMGDTTASPFFRHDLSNGAFGFGTTWTTSTILGNGFVTAAGLLWRVVNRKEQQAAVLQSCADADNTFTANAWSATYNLGNGFVGARDMVAFEDQVFVGATDGLYAGDASGTFVNVTPGLGKYGEESFRDLAIHNGEVVFPHAEGVYAYDPVNGGTREISPAAITPFGGGRGGKAGGVEHPNVGTIGLTITGAGNASPGVPSRLVGRFRAVHSYAGWLYVGLTTGSGQSHVLAGRETQAGWVWHPLQRLPSVTRVSRLYVDGAAYASGTVQMPVRIWALTDATVGGNMTGTAPVYFQRIPLHNGAPIVSDGVFSANYVGSGRVDLGATDWGAPGVPKVYRSAEVWADNLASGARYADVYYTIDSSASRALLGRVQTSPKSTLYFGTGTGSGFVTGQSIALSLQSYIATQFDTTPIYRSVVLRGALRPRSVDVITAQVRIADGIRDRRGTAMRSGTAMLSELRSLATQAAPVQLIDLAGATSWVTVQAPVDEQETYQVGDENPEIIATVRLAVMDYTGS